MSFREVQKRKALNSNVLGLEVKKFVTNRNNNIIMPSTPIKGFLNTNGFVEVLNGAKKSTGTESLESIIPKEADLSIKQNNGFSFFLWLYIFPKIISEKEKKKLLDDTGYLAKEKQKITYVFRRGSSIDEFTPTLALTNLQKSLLIEFSTSVKNKVNVMANKELEPSHLYSIGVSFEIDYEEDRTEVNIYIDGKLDTQSKIPGEPIHNQGNVFFGKIDYSSHGFRGIVADLMIMPSVLTENDMSDAHINGLKNLADSNGEYLNMNLIFNEILKRKRLINKYAFYTNKTKYEIENLCLSNSKMLDVVRNYDEEEVANDTRRPPTPVNLRRKKMLDLMKDFLKNEDYRILCNKIDMNSQLINTCFYLANEGEENLEINRVLLIFDTLQEVLLFTVTKDFLVCLAKILYAEKDNSLITNRFFKNLRESLDVFEQDERDEEAEIAKYAVNKKKKKKKKSQDKDIDNNKQKKKKFKEIIDFKTIRFNHLLRRKKDENSVPLPPVKTRGFGNCVTEHENLLLKTQNLRDCIEENQEQNLKNFHSMFRIKDLYEIPKNLPGEDSTCSKVEIIKSQISSQSSYILERNKSNNSSKLSFVSKEEQKSNQSNSNNNSNNNSFANSINSLLKSTQNEGNTKTKKIKKVELNDKDIENKKLIHDMLLEILNEDEDRVISPELGYNTPERYESVEKDIFRQREEIKQRIEELENKRLQEEMLRNKKEEIVPEAPKVIHYPFDPKYPEDWSNGSFELVINHCYDCHTHKNTTRHYEFKFVDKFNEIGDAVKKKFPNAIILGNLEEHEQYGNFDVYLRNTGLPSDEKGHYPIYSKYLTRRFPTTNEILDKLVCLSIMYGSSLNVEKAQVDLFNPEAMTSGRINISHEFPAELSEQAEKIRKKVFQKNPESKVDPERTKFFCTNNGCNKEFVKNQNHPKACCYHPGIYQFGSYNGLWPECWTCCEGKWGSKGCKEGMHKGVLLEKRIMLCLNHGSLNKDGHPDSVCGTWYTSRSSDGCKYHSGHVVGDKFTCCGQPPESPGCVEGPHATATFPDEKAKLYFYPKGINNPGLRYDKDRVLPTVSELIKRCDYFKTIKEYPDYKKLKDEEDRRIDRELDMDRICFHIGCNKKYRDKYNTEKSCMCHSGKWDFGGTKFNLGFIEEQEIKREMELEEERIKKTPHENDMNERKQKKSRELRLMHIEACYGKWRPHWTCCGGKWDAAPCTPCRHDGPLVEDAKKYYRPYIYPDIRLQFTYRRIVGDRWKDYIQQFMYDPKKVKYICKRFIEKKSHITLSNIHELLNILKLKYIIEQEDPSYYLKYRDLCLKQETFACLCNEGEQEINMDNFIKWWFSDYLSLYNIIHPPKKKEKKVEVKEEEKNSQ